MPYGDSGRLTGVRCRRDDGHEIIVTARSLVRPWAQKAAEQTVSDAWAADVKALARTLGETHISPHPAGRRTDGTRLYTLRITERSLQRICAAVAAHDPAGALDELT